MDGYFQHPPNVIPELVKKYNEGFDIVNTKRLDSKSISFFKKSTSKLFYLLINKLSDFAVEPFGADFRLMSRETVDAFLSIKEHDRFKSSYTLKKMIKLAINGITSMSSKPLRISLYLGLMFFISGIIYAIFIISNYYNGFNVAGWTSILITILILGGIQLLIMSIIGEYVAKIFNETKSRPLYLIKKKTKELS